MGNAATKGVDAYSMNLTDNNKLGEGAFGVVYKIMTKDQKTACAAKIFKIPFKMMNALEQLGYDRELKILQETSHPFVVKYMEEFVYQERLCIVTQFASGGDLDSFMKKKRTFTEDEAMHYFTMILIALHYLHSKEIVHRDLKPANILLDELPGGLNILKIGDFGISKVDIQEMKKTVTATMGGQTSPAYIAPEVIKNEPPTKKVDMWALGIILYQLVTKLNHPFDCFNAFAMIDSIKNNEPAPLPPTVSPFIKEIITALLDKNAKSRPDAQTLIDREEIQVYVKRIISQVSASDKIAGKLLKKQFATKIRLQDSNGKSESYCSISQEDLEFLHEQLDYKNVSFKLLYRASRNGWKPEKFHKLCDNKGPTLSLFEILNGECIGGYTNAQWQSSSPYGGMGSFWPDKDAMLFNLTTHKSFPCKEPDYAIWCQPDCGPSFGSEELFWSGGFNQNEYRSYTNEKGYNIPRNSEGINMLTSKKCQYDEDERRQNRCFFDLSELEVWGVSFND